MSRNDLLFEIGTEEIPASFVPLALDALKRSAEDGFKDEHLSFESISVMGTPRRLAICVQGLSERQPDRQEVIAGPPVKVAFSPEGVPTKAAEGFARKNNVSVEELKVRDTEKGEKVVIERVVPGRDTVDLLREMLPSWIRSIPFPKTMRWGRETLRFARPIRWIVAIYGDEVVPFELAGVASGRHSRGHRFMSAGEFEVSSSRDQYLKILRDNYVLVDPEERKNVLTKEAEDAASNVGGKLLQDDDLSELNNFLVEYPTAVCGSFEERFLKLPREVLITSMKEHQKYFAVVNDDGSLMPYFVAINNTRSLHPELVKKGHERVLRARLSDAAFFFEEDKRRPLESFVEELSGMVFHERLGTLLDKTKRVKAIAGYLARLLAPQSVSVAERAAWLCKADLLTEMVGEFPTLQGVMGREYALISGESPEVAEAIAEHYMPVRAGGQLPSSIVSCVVSIADKIDTVCSTFAIGLEPSGTADPYGLRRLALGILHILLGKEIHLSLKSLIGEAILQLKDYVDEATSDLGARVLSFFERRFSYDYAARGFAHDVIEAAIRADFDDPLDCAHRIKALSAMRERPEFEPLSMAFKRVMNILKGFPGGAVEPSLLEEDAEKDLYDAYLALEQKVRSFLDEKNYEEALSTLLTIKPQVDGFFDNVLVMAEDERVRENRLALLYHISRLFLKIGDLSAISVEKS